MRAATSFATALALLAVACGSSSRPEDAAPPTRYSASHGKTPDGSVDLLVLEDSAAQTIATVAPSKGGELSSLRLKIGDHWIETLYRAEDYSTQEGWTGKAPLLWPATGRNFPPGFKPETKPDGSIERGRYDLDGKRYEMPGHGFVRDMPWKVEQLGVRDGAYAALSLEDTEQTRALYPFGFRLDVAYTLHDGDLEIAYTVAAKPDNARPMPFSIGNHITFNTPLIPGSDLSQVRFSTPSERELVKENGLPTGAGTPRSHADGVPLADFEKLAAISLTGYESDPWMELSDPQGLTIRLTHHADRWPEQPFIQFNVWGDAPSGYFSPEPWVGLQQSFVLDQGMTRLQPGESWHWKIRIDVERTAP
ncbi:MAG: hypothetical protein GC160_01185 [Acidobacteria bacterium]|nr:hypothetical protein [Acidobacteriota bacterium]